VCGRELVGGAAAPGGTICITKDAQEVGLFAESAAVPSMGRKFVFMEKGSMGKFAFQAISEDDGMKKKGITPPVRESGPEFSWKSKASPNKGTYFLNQNPSGKSKWPMLGDGNLTYDGNDE